MVTRTLSHWLTSIALAVFSLVAINLLVATSPVQGRPVAALINCSGSIQACINAANDGDTILIAAGTYTESLTLSKPVSLTGENRDTTIIHAVAGQRVLTVTGAAISTSVVISGLTFTGGSADNGGGTLIADGAQPTLQAVQFINNAASSSGGGLYATSPLTLANAEFISNTAGWGGGLYTQGALLTLIDTDFITNVGGGADADYATAQVIGGQFIANSGGSAALSIAGPVIISGTRFTDNSGGYDAGGLYVRTGDKILTNTLFINNSGGGFVIGGDGPVTIYGGRFERNHTAGRGGAISFGPLSYSANLTLIGTEVMSNTASSYGGGLYLAAYPIANIIDSHFENNLAGGDGGGIAMGNGVLNSSNSHFENNIANGMGGGVFATFTQFYLTDTQFISNAARTGGGGMQGGHGYVTGGRFERNSVTEGYGGGWQGGDFIMSGTLFISNTAAYGGGGALSIGPHIEINGGRFENNRTLVPSPYSSQHCGGGGLSAGGRLIVITGTQFNNNTSAANGGGLCTGGDSQVVNVLFANNTATLDGAAIFIEVTGQYTLLHTTIASRGLNPQPAVSVLSGTLNLTNTIIANHAIGISNTGGTVYEDYNLFYNVITNTIGVTNGGHSLVGDPKFVDPLGGDYHLQFGSAAIDRGIDAGIYTDLDGNPRPIGFGFDIGAYEYQSGHYLWLPLIRK